MCMYNYQKTYGFSLKRQTYKTGSPASFVGRYISCLTCIEKENRLIGKLFTRIRHPKLKESEVLSESFGVRISRDGNCHLIRRCDGQEIRVKNLGTAETPAFFFKSFIFVFDPKEEAFISAELKVIAFTDWYVVMWIADNLLIKFDVRGLGCIGAAKNAHIVPFGVVLLTENGDKSCVWAVSTYMQKLFELSEQARYSVDNQTGNVTHEYVKEGLPSELCLDTYALEGDTYVLTD